MSDNKPTPEAIKAINDHLDALLGMDVRKPGTAATLPAVIRITETLEPAGGRDFPVFPPSYAGENTGDPARYDLNGVDWGHRETTLSNGTKRVTPYIKSARHCTMDSPQSHANLTEIAFSKDEMLRKLVPTVAATYPRHEKFVGPTKIETVDVLTLPHRVADFRVRASHQAQRADDAIKALAKGNALPLLQLMPTSVIFGFWDSRAEGYQHKHARILLTRIDAFNVVPCEKHALYNGPYSKDECAIVVVRDDAIADELSDSGKKQSDRAKQWDKAMAERGFSNALGSGLGGVFAERVERLALVSLTDIASIFCQAPAEPTETTEAENQESIAEQSKRLTDAARRYLLALALLAENYPRSTGSYRLRSGCELLPSKKEIALLGSGAESDSAKALRSLCENRALLIAVADAARSILGIEIALDPFLSDPDSLRSYLGKEIKSEQDSAKEKKAAETAAKKAQDQALNARNKAQKATDAAKVAADKAAQSNKPKDQEAAEKKTRDAEELSQKAAELEQAAKEAAEKLSALNAQPADVPATNIATESPNPTPEA